jgi:hypothetical protein
MANRQFQQYSYQLEKGVVTLYVRVNIGATGAPTLVTTSTSGNPSNGIATISRSSAGKYVITFGNVGSTQTNLDTYQRLLWAQANVIASTISTVVSTQISVESVTSASAPSITIQCLAAAGTAVDPNNGDVLLIKIALKNATV